MRTVLYIDTVGGDLIQDVKRLGMCRYFSSYGWDCPWVRVRVEEFVRLARATQKACPVFRCRAESRSARRNRLGRWVARLPRRCAVFAVNDYTAMDLIRREACNGLTAASVVARFEGSRRFVEKRFRETFGHSIPRVKRSIRKCITLSCAVVLSLCAREIV